MIKVNELRIGNLVYFLGNVHEIEGISKRLRPDVGHFQLSGIEHSQKGFHLKPIPLTEEWLVKFGFEKLTENAYTYTGRYTFTVFFDGERLSTSFWQGNEKKYVHQLQNLYFALTGEEFTIKE